MAHITIPEFSEMSPAIQKELKKRFDHVDNIFECFRYGKLRCYRGPCPDHWRSLEQVPF